MSVKFDISPALQAAIRLGATAREATTLQSRLVGTLRRRMPVATRRDIQTEYNLTATRINSGLRSRAVEGGVDVIGSGRGIGLIEYAGRWAGLRSPGATAQVRKGEGRTTYPGEFIATLLGGNRQIVARVWKPREMTQGRYRGKIRQPIAVQYGPSLAQALRRPGRLDRLRGVQDDVLSAELARLLRSL